LSGHYSALLGSSSAIGIPVDVFSDGEARWLGVQAKGQRERPSVMLVSVPYAMKASDAETLGGLPASAFFCADATTVLKVQMGVLWCCFRGRKGNSGLPSHP